MNVTVPMDHEAGQSGGSPTFSSLAWILNCPICKELMKEPVMAVTGCSHNFCSLCARESLSVAHKCPVCFVPLTDQLIKPNRALKNIIDVVGRWWPNANDCSQQQQQQPQPLSDQDNQVEPCDTQPTEAAPRLSPPPDTVMCPVCAKSVARIRINAHLDGCLTLKSGPSITPTKTMVLRRTPKAGDSLAGGQRKPMIKVVYHLLKLTQLRKLLKEQGLPLTGDRKKLERRHQKFCTLWNSQCEVEHPMSRAQIIQTVMREEEQGAVNSSTQSSLTNSLFSVDRNHLDITALQSIQKEYLNQNKATFDQLVTDIKRRRQKENVASVLPEAALATSTPICARKRAPLENQNVGEGPDE